MSAFYSYLSIRDELRILYNCIDQSRFHPANDVTLRIQNLMRDTLQGIPQDRRSEFQTSAQTLNALAARLVPLLGDRAHNGLHEPPIDIQAEQRTQLFMVQYISDCLPVANIIRWDECIYVQPFNA